MGDLIRSFLCLELPAMTRQALEDETFFLHTTYPAFKWVSTDALHITLKFFGEQEREFLDLFAESLEERLEVLQLEALRFSCGPLGAFPDMRRVQTLTVEVLGDLFPLQALAVLVEDVAEMHGIPREKRFFKPHITLARTRRPETVDQQIVFPKRKIEWKADTVTLMKSTLKPTGPVYAPIRNWRFLKNG